MQQSEEIDEALLVRLRAYAAKPHSTALAALSIACRSVHAPISCPQRARADQLP